LAKASAELINPEKAADRHGIELLASTLRARRLGSRRERLFCGLLVRGWRRSRRDVWFVIVLTALLWAVVHLQYDPYVIAQVLAYGVAANLIRIN
jgi:hypothetical protein